MSSAPLDILRTYWGYDHFRPLQEDIITTVLNDKDALALLPTGGGKSICFQVPALARDGICLVVSPLIALMKDQVENLRKRGILALAIYSGLSRRQLEQTLKNAASGQYKLLYISPERIETALFKEYLPALDVNLIAVDEAHCISQWGHDFRPSYRRIAALREELPDVPVLALTASATPAVEQDIIQQLGLKGSHHFRQSYERKNLSYSAFKAVAKPAKLIDIITKVPGTAIVYCKSRRRTVEVARLLQLHGIAAHYYHAGLPAAERTQKQSDWITNQVRVMACTNAFGMGIDKPDVRLVVHADVPDSLENYYQEAGRAGRDGKKSYAVLLYTDSDISELEAQASIRFPPLETVTKVYEALVNYLQMPSYTGEDQRFEFNFSEFVTNFGLDSQTALYSLKAMESDGWLVFTEKSFTPATVVFTTNKRGLQEFQQAYPKYELLITTLLRTYEGIFDYPAAVSEPGLARLLRLPEETIVTALKELTALRLLQYTTLSEVPLITFKKHRVQVADFRIDPTPYAARKSAYQSRVTEVVNYTATDDCRSRVLNTYFGDPTSPCGTCDNCLRKKATTLGPEEWQRISNRILKLIEFASMEPAALVAALHPVGKEKAWKVLDFLQAEQKIELDKSGRFRLIAGWS